MSKDIEAVLSAAKGEVGVREATGNNDGARVAMYLASCGINFGAAWCGAFVQWCLNNGLNSTKRVGEVWSPPNPAYCPSIYTWARGKGILHSNPKRGDVFLYVDSDGWALHTGFVTGSDGARFTTIEGNTNGAGSSEGDGVYERSRPINGAYKFVRWVDLLPKTEPAATFALILDGTKVADMPVKNGRSYIWLGDWARAVGLPLTWDAKVQKPRLDGFLVTADIEIRDNRAWAQVNQLLAGSGLAYKVDLAGRRVVVSKGG